MCIGGLLTYLFVFWKVNNTALAQVLVLPAAGSAQFNSVFQKIMSCHVCLGKSCSYTPWIRSPT